MKARNTLIFILGTLITPIYLVSCGEDRWAEYAGQIRTDRWIDDTMRVWYYWNENIPHASRLNYFQPPFSFYASLLSKNDGKGGLHYSTIDSLKNATRSIPYTDYSYGFQFTTNRVQNNDTALYAHVLYVAPNTPASAVKLKRGDWVMRMNGKPITEKNYRKLYGAEAMELTVGYYDARDNAIVAYKEPREIAPARAINDNPVYYRNVYTRGSKRVGYLVYNHFSSGVTDKSEEYNNALRDASQYFSGQQVNEFILDLRYNNGGMLSCAELMCTLLAPANKLGQVLGYLEFNNRVQPKNVPFRLNPNLIQGGANLNLSTLYILTSEQTASASEMVINCLKPLMDKVFVIGSITEGKNVGSTTFTNPELMISMSPIVCKIYNSEGKSDYEKGLKPDLEVSENSDLAKFLPFGDPDERMLYTALKVIDGNLELLNKRTPALETSVITNSIERRGSHAVEIENDKKGKPHPESWD